MKTKKLKYKPDYDFNLIGVSCAEEDYKLSWEIAKLLKISFAKAEDLKIIDSRFSDYLNFSVFENSDKSNHVEIKLISNKGKEGFLIEELKNIDFFVIVYDVEHNVFFNDFVAKLKKSDLVTAVFKIDIEKLKSREKLLF